ncbi:MAG: hypothetical protein OXG85_10630 [Chloroflexi bacterium]|nr:hypothetical protein [Chloroflexota bacterium]
MAAIIQVAVGIIFVFILLSIVVTEVNSLVARATKLRAKTLRSTIDAVIEDPVIRAKVYTHPLIQLVKADPIAPTQRISRAEAEKIAGGSIGAVDYIEPRAFVDVVLNTIKAQSDQQLFGALLNVIDGMPAGRERRGLRVMVNRIVTTGQGMNELRDSLRFVQDRRYRSALTDLVNQIDEEVSLLGLEPTTDVSLMVGIRQIENPNLRKSLSAVLASADNLEEARGNLETWYMNSMSRATALYKSRMKNLSVLVALTFALALNIDTLHIARALWEDPAQREQISSQATYSIGSDELQAQLDGGDSDGEFKAIGANEENPLADAIGAGAEVAYQLQDIQDLSLPIGWTFHKVDEGPNDRVALRDPNNLWNYIPENNPENWLGLLAAKLLGIAVTVIAAAQGAPFWFGIVNRILRR